MEVGLRTFIKFVNATPRVRPRIGRAIGEQLRSEYNPATDFWRPMRSAIARDRKTTRDGATVRETVRTATSRSRPSFEVISSQWDELSPRWTIASHVSSNVTHIDVGGVSIRISPLFSEQWDDGHIEAAHVYFNKEELHPETLQYVQHLLTMDAHPQVVQPIFFDMRRGLAVPASPHTGSIIDELEEFGAELQQLAS